MRGWIEKPISSLWLLPCSLILLLFQSKTFVHFIIFNPRSFTSQSVLQIASHIADLVLACILFAGFFHFGRKIFKLFKLETDVSSIESLVYSLVFGEAVTAFILFALGLSGWLTAGIWIVFLCLCYGAFRQANLISIFVEKLKKFISEKIPAKKWICLCLIGTALLRIIIATGAPPTDWDSLAYHLAFPKIFLNAGRIYRLPWSMNAHYPLNTEMIYTLALGLKGDLAAHWINFLHGILLILLIIALTQRYFSSEAAIGAALLFVLQPVTQRVSGNAAADLAVALIFICALTAFFRIEEAGDECKAARWLFLTGSFCGIAMSSKLTGTWLTATLVSILIVSHLYRSIRNHQPLSAIHYSLFTFLAGVILLGFPWYLKNFFWTGNPVWPYLGEWFRSSPMDIESWHRMRASVTEGIEKTFLNWILLPFKLISRSDAFHYQPQSLMVPFLSLLGFRFFLPQPFSNVTKKCFLILGIFGTIWFFIYADWRYFLPMTALICILISQWTLEFLDGKNWRRAVSIVTLFAIVPFKELTGGNEAFAFLGLKSIQNPEISTRDRYLELTLDGLYKFCQIANIVLPQNAKVLFFRDVRGYYLDRDYAWGDPLNPGVFSYSRIQDPNQLYETLRAQGFTHIFYNPFIGNYQGDQSYYARSNRLMEEMIQRHARLVFSVEGHALYEIE